MKQQRTRLLEVIARGPQALHGGRTPPHAQAMAHGRAIGRSTVNLLVYGNSGSGKSTYAKALAERHALAHLDLDTIVWAPEKVAVQRSGEAITASLDAFLAMHARWVIEGCYSELVQAVAPHCSELIFLNPGREACLANNRQRPWEPHNYASPQAQDAMLESLQAWVVGYYERDGDWSYRRHRHIFDSHAGPKREHARRQPAPTA